MSSQQHMTPIGLVRLVGAGPGDPELLTVKAWKAIEQASVVVYDNLVSAAIRQLFPQHAKHIYVGKAKGCHHYQQSDIQQLMLNYALAGERVCRVKGGDAFVFGRGGEEMLFLTQHGVSVEVIPGITAASGCTSYANIPLTHRGVSQGCTLITAHADQSLDVNWSALAQLQHTLVIYMGLTKADLIQQSLLDAGMAAQTPIAVIEKGCTPEQRTLTGGLSELVDIITDQQVQSPALIVIGEVVQIANQMNWLMQRVSRERVDQPSHTCHLTHA